MGIQSLLARQYFGKWLLGTVLTGFSAVASAEIYFGASLGLNSINSNDAQFFEVEDESTAFETMVGVRLIDVLAVEASYLNLGDFRDYYYETDLNFSGLTLSAKALLPLGPQMDLYAKVGAFFWSLEEQYHGDYELVDDGTDLFVGGGALFHLTDNLDLNLEYKSMEMDKMRSGAVTAGIRLVF
jgi:opacity protein-like surface antigen